MLRWIIILYCTVCVCAVGCGPSARMAEWKKKWKVFAWSQPDPTHIASLPTSPEIGSSTAAALSNPLYVPPVDREFLWNQIVDTVNDYFRISQERRVQDIGGQLTDGRIDTLPTTGSTLLEPWRGDSTRGYERLHATLQTVRRQAMVTVAPDHQGYFVEVIVEKELEAVGQPEHASVGSVTLRHDTSLTSRQKTRRNRVANLGWVPQGRDISLEQKILQEIRGRVASIQPGAR